MGNNVFANGREISCKAADGKAIAAFPDVCFTPPDKCPPTPMGVPCPYPNTGMAKDATKGSKKVKISGKEVMLKNKSHFKKSMGDEAGCATKKGVLTSKNRGKVYFNAWSMDVKFEGHNVVRHLDLSTHNHASQVGQTPPWPYADTQMMGKGGACENDVEKEKEACKDYKPYTKKDPCPKTVAGVKVTDLSQRREHKPAYEALAKRTRENECLSARRCQLTPYGAEKDGVGGCCPGQTGDHVIDDANFKNSSGKYIANYSHSAAPCICAAGPNNTWASHGESHTIKGHFAKCYKKKHGVSKIPYAAQRKMSATAVCITFKESGCSKKCIEAQLDNYFKNEDKPICDDDTPLAGKASGRNKNEFAKEKLGEIAKR